MKDTEEEVREADRWGLSTQFSSLVAGTVGGGAVRVQLLLFCRATLQKVEHFTFTSYLLTITIETVRVRQYLTT